MDKTKKKEAKMSAKYAVYDREARAQKNAIRIKVIQSYRKQYEIELEKKE